MTCENIADCFHAGETYQLAAYCLGSNGQAVSLSGYTATLNLKKRADEWSDAALTLTSTPAAGITITAATGRLDVVISDTQSAALEGAYDMKLEIESGSGVVTRILSGTLTVYE